MLGDAVESVGISSDCFCFLREIGSEVIRAEGWGRGCWWFEGKDGKWPSGKQESGRTREMLWDCPLQAEPLHVGGLLPWHRRRALGSENQWERTRLRAESGGRRLLWTEPRTPYLWETLSIPRATRIRVVFTPPD